MQPVKRIVQVIPTGHWPDSAEENLRYWLSRPPAERVEAGRRLRRDTYRRLHGHDLPAMRKIVSLYKPAA